MCRRTLALNALRAFEVAARHKSLAKAAEELRKQIIGGVIAYLLIKSGLKAASLSQVTLPRTAEQISRDLRTIKETTSS